MAFKKIPLTIDTMIRNPVPVEGINQEDNIELNIVVTENKTPKDLSSQTIKVYVRRIDGTLVEQTNQITLTNARKGEVTVKLKNSAFNKEGYALFQLDVSDSIGRITSSYATFKIGKGLVSGEAIANTNEIEALKKVEEYIKKANQELETFKQTVTEINENEASRNEAEKLRVATETGRVGAESLRVIAEEKRVAAETKREEEFNKFESKINANTKELKNARTATTGEKFNSLDERIDCEVDRLNKKIEVSFLQQEDKENHVIENTIEGMTTDMVIKGRTLMNMVKLGNVSNDIGILGSTVARYSYCYNLKNNIDYTIIFEIENKTDDNQVAISLNAGTIGSRYSVRNGVNVLKVRSANEFNTEIWFYYHSDNVGGSGSVKNIIVLEGDWTNKPIPKYFEGIKSFGEQESNKISILSHGKNLTNFENLIVDMNGTTHELLDNGIKVTSPSDNHQAWCFSMLKVNVKENTDYYCSFKYKTMADGVGWIAIRTTSDVLIKDFGLREGAFNSGYNKEIVVQFYASLETSIINNTVEYYDFQIEEGTQATQYEPYIEDKKDILIKEPLREDDYLYEDNGQVKIDRESGQYTFIGDERITKENTLINITRFYIDTQCKNKVNTRNIICDNFNSNGTWWDRDEIGMYWDTIVQGRLWFHISKTKFNDVESFKNFLKANPTTIIYELDTPTVEVVEDFVNIDLKTFNEKTHVSFENAISGTSSFKAPVDTTATIARLNRENRALEEENRSLRQDFESTTLSLTDSDLELVKQNVDMDFRLMEVEFALDIPQSTLSSNINFKKKGEVKSMARTPYAMMKIVILSGDYDREDYIHKVGKYYERGRMTKEEYDELMSLMTADEVIGG